MIFFFLWPHCSVPFKKGNICLIPLYVSLQLNFVEYLILWVLSWGETLYINKLLRYGNFSFKRKPWNDGARATVLECECEM